MSTEIAELKNKLIAEQERTKNREKQLDDVNSSYQNLKNISDETLQKQTNFQNEDSSNVRKVLEEMNSKLRQSNKGKLDLEEQLQTEKEKRLDLERQNNFLRVSSVQNQRDELEIERLRAEVSRLRNLASEYKDQAVFYGGNNAQERPSFAEQSLRQSNIAKQLPISQPSGQNNRNSVGFGLLNLTPAKEMRTVNEANESAVKQSLPFDSRFSKAMGNYVTNNKDLNWRKVKAIGKGDLFENQDLRIEVQSKPIKLNSKDRLFYKLVFIFINKSDFLTVQNLTPVFAGHKSKDFL